MIVMFHINTVWQKFSRRCNAVLLCLLNVLPPSQFWKMVVLYLCAIIWRNRGASRLVLSSKMEKIMRISRLLWQKIMVFFVSLSSSCQLFWRHSTNNAKNHEWFLFVLLFLFRHHSTGRPLTCLLAYCFSRPYPDLQPWGVYIFWLCKWQKSLTWQIQNKKKSSTLSINTGEENLHSLLYVLMWQPECNLK